MATNINGGISNEGGINQNGMASAANNQKA